MWCASTGVLLPRAPCASCESGLLPPAKAAACAYNKGMKNEATLSTLSNAELEALYEAYSADDCSDEQWDGLMAEMLRRDDFIASTHELEYTLECWA
jgi:hypothetical protein